MNSTKWVEHIILIRANSPLSQGTPHILNSTILTLISKVFKLHEIERNEFVASDILKHCSIILTLRLHLLM